MVPAATVIVPSGFMVIEPAVGVGAVPGVSEISDGTTGAPFNKSLPNTVGVEPPVKPFMAVGISAIAAIAAGATMTVAVVVAQFVGFNFSQMV